MNALAPIDTPTSLPEARMLRDAAIAELSKLHRELPRAQGGMREFLKTNAEATMQRIRGLNEWIATEGRRIGSETRPSREYQAALAAAPAPPREPSPTETCACGELVTGDRAADAWIFYCASCGQVTERPADRVQTPPRPRPQKRCRCARVCWHCGGERR